MSSLSAIRKDLLEVDPAVEWIAFGFGGGGDDFQGFQSFETYKNGKKIRGVDNELSSYFWEKGEEPIQRISEKFSITKAQAQELMQLKGKFKEVEVFRAEAMKLLSSYVSFDFEVFSKWDSILNEASNSGTILNAILPEGIYLKCTDSGSCSGVLLFVLEQIKNPLSLDLQEHSSADTHSFYLQSGFRGIAVDFYNSDRFTGEVSAK